mmetsp:Transcript_26966/g.41331  ORF Transcript_26966/g.41331 Transcript_26966/m.41331 type:complete len:203 (+) Transcript_26966:152-760(+)|eukprot:CAMPEP_0195281402 /NCGR_PEP_ID=MMETSP0707-20130614/727_1 /TAXON_ID=33640 /ORGANISM="Asterionellopsis glacialis, Strain CCMP134" /LENGTH=202 /DNA_ID=CAMNT_0040340285 /DNA_START=152 /DNA_END=760 /DNA_ORIENTATION=-
MSTPVVTDQWAGNFDCDFCRRKRLMGSEFSKKALERYRKTGGPLKCKQCVAKVEKEERKAAAARNNHKVLEKDGSSGKNEKRVCSSCSMELDQSSYNRNQWSKGDGKSRCRNCVEQALQDEATEQSKSKQEQISQAKDRVKKANASGNAVDIIKAESALAALEAEKVTGLRPVKLGRGGRGRGPGGGGRGRGRGRGRGSGRR